MTGLLEQCTGYSLLAIGIYLLVILLGMFSTWLWNFIDDFDKPLRQNMVVRFGMRVIGFEPHPTPTSLRTGYQRIGSTSGEEYDSDNFIWVGGFLVFGTPAAIAVTKAYSQFVLSIAICVAVVFMARFMRRHKKLFDRHVADKDAHK